jgi:hypothetical protein
MMVPIGVRRQIAGMQARVAAWNSREPIDGTGMPS